MGSVVLFLIIALLIKRGMIDKHGLSDAIKVFGTVAIIAFIVSLFAKPLMLVLGGIGVIAGIIALVNKLSSTERSDINRAHAEEFRQMYNEVFEMKMNEFRSKHDAAYNACNATERRMRDLQEERMAREAAARFVNEQIRKKYGDAAVPVSTGQYTNGAYSANAPRPQAPAYNYQPGAMPQNAQPRPQQPKPIKSAILPKASGRRTKIVKKFNEQYSLYLTDEQIRNIVAASYMSNAWKQEVEAMYIKYDSVYQWLVGPTAYLRAYLRAFAVQDVTSDFMQQQRIVTESFQEIFDYSDTISGLTLERRIEMINSKFLTNFDDITYMIAYRYLEAMGFHHQLETAQLNRIDGTFDDLVAKYDRMSTEGVDAGLSQITPAAAAAPAADQQTDGADFVYNAPTGTPPGTAAGGGA